MTRKARAARERSTRLPGTVGLRSLDAVSLSAKNAAVPLTPLDQRLGDLPAAALLKDLLEHPREEPTS